MPFRINDQDFLQFKRGQEILTLFFLQIRRQLQGHRTYFFPGGAFLIGVASLQQRHFATKCLSFPEIK